MKINRNNVTYYVRLYLERKLDPVKTAELMLFFSENPEIEKDLNISGNFLLQPDDISYPEKDNLKKNFTDIAEINEHNFDEFCIASAENLLNDTDEKRLRAYIALDAEKEKDAILYKQLKIKPDLKIRFREKSSIKKPVHFLKQHKVMLFVTGIAASVALIFFIFKERPDETIPARNYVSQNTVPAIADENPLPYEEAPADENGATVSEFPETEIVVTAHFDTGTEAVSAEEPERKDIPPLKSIYPAAAIRLEVVNNKEELVISPDHPVYAQQITSSSPQQNNNQEDNSGNRLVQLLRNLNLWETSLYAVKGFNILTESNLSVQKTTDTQGKITGLIIDTESRTLLATSAK